MVGPAADEQAANQASWLGQQTGGQKGPRVSHAARARVADAGMLLLLPATHMKKR